MTHNAKGRAVQLQEPHGPWRDLGLVSMINHMVAGAVTKTAAKTFLSVVYGFSGVVKLKDHHGTKRELIKEGLSPTAASYAAHILPVLEITMAVGLHAPSRFQRCVLMCSRITMMTFTAHLAKKVIQRDLTSCACFGQHLASVSGSKAVARNLVLILLHEPINDKSFWRSSSNSRKIVVSAASMVTSGALLAGLVKIEQQVMASLFPMKGSHLGERVVRELLYASGNMPQSDKRDTVSPEFYFISPGCSSCDREIDRLAGMKKDLRNVTIVTSGEYTNSNTLNTVEDMGATVVNHPQLFEVLRVRYTPSYLELEYDTGIVRDSREGFVVA